MKNLPTYLASGKGGVTLRIYLAPRASVARIIGVHGDRLKIAVSGPPVDGAANDELMRLLSKVFKVPRNRVEITSGARNRNKVVQIQGAELEQIHSLLKKFL